MEEIIKYVEEIASSSKGHKGVLLSAEHWISYLEICRLAREKLAQEKAVSELLRIWSLINKQV